MHWAQCKGNFFLWLVLKKVRKATVLAVSEHLRDTISIGHQKENRVLKTAQEPKQETSFKNWSQMQSKATSRPVEHVESHRSSNNEWLLVKRVAYFYPVIIILIHGPLEMMWHWRTRDKGQVVDKKGRDQSEKTSAKQEDWFRPATYERCHPRGKSISSSTRRCLQKSHAISCVYVPKLTVTTLCCFYYLQVITFVVF